MKVTVRTTRNFQQEAKPLLKKFKSLRTDLLVLEKEIVKSPRIGTPLGNNCYKIRLKISSKGKGKSGGARVISLVETELIGIAIVNEENEITVSLLSIYDKSEMETISDKELRELVEMYSIH